MNWNKVGALANIGLLVVTLVTLAIPHLTNGPSISPWRYVPIVLLSACVVLAWFNWRAYQAVRSHQPDKAPTDPASDKVLTLVFRLMEEECSDILRKYRELDQSYREQVKLPLSTNSWPEMVGGKWEYHHLLLWKLYGRVMRIRKAAMVVWEEMGWRDQPVIFQTADSSSTVMANLIGDLEDFLRILGSKVSLLESRQVH